LACPRQPALAWGDEGHEVVGLVAQTYLTPEAGNKVNALIAADPDPLTAHEIASESTWADKLRDANGGGARPRRRRWHFVEIELDRPDLDQARFCIPVFPTAPPHHWGPHRTAL